jgi:hypothetical protein
LFCDHLHRNTSAAPSIALAATLLPVAGRLHIFRYTFAGDKCLLEHFSAEPGKTPEPTELQPENRLSCLVRDN